MMQLLNNFFTISNLQAVEGSLSCSITFDAAHEIFGGHFPSQPVVPGVCSMQIVKALLEAALGNTLILKKAPVVKFLQLIPPHCLPHVTIRWNNEEDMISAVAEFKIAGIPAFKMNATYTMQV